MQQFIITMLVIIQLQLLAALVVYTRSTRHKRGTKPVFIDTSVLMDGRIVSIITSGFMPETIKIPRSVLRELQLLADGADSARRARARHGLDIAKQLQELSPNVSVISDSAPIGVDEQLIQLAKTYGGSICTIDFNLNKLAQAQSIVVLNPNDLSRDLRMSYLPGERTSVFVAQKGNEAQQGVGYLEDGTMVVIDHAKKDIGSMQAVEIVKSIQTAAGKMLFAKKIANASEVKVPASKPTGKKKVEYSRPPKRGTEDSLVALANKS